MVKQTSLYNQHVNSNAKMVEFAGWMMPVSYTSIIDEHMTVRNDVGIFDVSHMGEFFVEGKDSLLFLNSLVPQDVAKLVDSKAVYCQLLNDNAGLIDDLIIYKLEVDKYLVIVNASRIEEDYNWMSEKSKAFDVKLENKSEEYSLIAVQGPKASDVLAKLGMLKDDQPKFFSIKPFNLLGVDLFVSRTGYTGEDGFEILLKNEYAEKLWVELLNVGINFNLKPIGLGARDTLRLEAGMHLYGNDLDENTTPIEAGLSWSVAKKKEADYTGKNVILSQLENGIDKKLVGLKMVDRAIARHGYDIYYGDNQVGVVTSGGVSPVRGDNIAMGYVNNVKDICTGSLVQVKIREKLYNAEIVKIPFIQKNNK